jgi:hypothetical protein
MENEKMTSLPDGGAHDAHFTVCLAQIPVDLCRPAL